MGEGVRAYDLLVRVAVQFIFRCTVRFRDLSIPGCFSVARSGTRASFCCREHVALYITGLVSGILLFLLLQDSLKRGFTKYFLCDCVG